jgi:hypothetical protein
MMTDLFWNAATSTVTLSLVGLVLLAAFLVAHVPGIVERVWPQAYVYAKAAALVQVLAAALLFFLVGFRVADERAETRQLKNDLTFKEIQIENSEATAKEAERLKAEAEAKADEAKEKLDDFRKRFGDRPEAVCAFNADDLERLRALGRAKRR